MDTMYLFKRHASAASALCPDIERLIMISVVRLRFALTVAVQQCQDFKMLDADVCVYVVRT